MVVCQSCAAPGTWMCPAAFGGGEQQKVTPFCELARDSWQDARCLAIKKSHRREPRDDGFRENELG